MSGNGEKKASYPCYKCSKTFDTLGKLNHHLKYDHKEDD